MRLPIFFVLMFVATSAEADTSQVTRARQSLNELQQLTTELAKESSRDASVLRLLTDAARNLDDWQTQASFAKAQEDIAKAEQLLGKAPVANPIMREAVNAARAIVDDIKGNPSAANWSKVRTELHERAIDRARMVVSEEMHSLAMLSVLVSDVIADLTEALSDGSSAAWARER